MLFYRIEGRDSLIIGQGTAGNRAWNGENIPPHMAAEQNLADVVSQLLQCCIEFHQADLSGGVFAEE